MIIIENDNSEERELNIDKALDVINYSNELPNITPQNEVIENHNCTHIVSSDFLLWLSGIFLVL